MVYIYNFNFTYTFKFSLQFDCHSTGKGRLSKRIKWYKCMTLIKSQLFQTRPTSNSH